MLNGVEVILSFPNAFNFLCFRRRNPQLLEEPGNFVDRLVQIFEPLVRERLQLSRSQNVVTI